MLDKEHRMRYERLRPLSDFQYAYYRDIVQDIRYGVYDRVYELESADSFLRYQGITRTEFRYWTTVYNQRKDYWLSVSRVRQAIATVRRGRIRQYDLALIDAFIRQHSTDQFVRFFSVELDEYQSWNPLELEEDI
jgi:hypothetical protein